ncbi:hypothetical protein DL96DRAFT_1708103 [Flagelloscypha sp. PMI_526]|nr:hypothetical protein DL96DRAFT_1708103 [Flagelloscypha sp. PMI_526]
MKASHNLPLDILRLLFEFSASASFESAKSLSLVSREVQSWTDPHLFQIVHGHIGNGCDEFWTCLLDEMCMPDASPRLILARNYVRAVAWKEMVDENSDIEKPLDHFSNLVQICLWSNFFPGQLDYPLHDRLEITQAYPSLRRVATCIFDERTTPLNAFGSPFWTAITHLQLLYHCPMSSPYSPFQSPLFATMPSLTHLALLSEGSGIELDVDLALSRVRDSFPKSLVLCLLRLRVPFGSNEEYWTAEMANTSSKIDQRIVMWMGLSEINAGDMVVTSDDNFQDWCGVHDGVQTIWDKGEAILKKRQLRAVAV